MKRKLFLVFICLLASPFRQTAAMCKKTNTAENTLANLIEEEHKENGPIDVVVAFKRDYPYDPDKMTWNPNSTIENTFLGENNLLEVHNGMDTADKNDALYYSNRFSSLSSGYSRRSSSSSDSNMSRSNSLEPIKEESSYCADFDDLPGQVPSADRSASVSPKEKIKKKYDELEKIGGFSNDPTLRNLAHSMASLNKQVVCLAQKVKELSTAQQENPVTTSTTKSNAQTQTEPQGDSETQTIPRHTTTLRAKLKNLFCCCFTKNNS